MMRVELVVLFSVAYTSVAPSAQASSEKVTVGIVEGGTEISSCLFCYF